MRMILTLLYTFTTGLFFINEKDSKSFICALITDMYFIIEIMEKQVENLGNHDRNMVK